MAESSDVETSQSEPEVELLATHREKRRNRGNRYEALLAEEQEAEAEASAALSDQDEVALLFGGEEEGSGAEEFDADADDEDNEMSSSDDDDQGPNANGDELDGEQALQRQEKAERQKKRKADLALTNVRKKPKFDPTSLHRKPDRSRPSKRKERESWLPESNVRAARASQREATKVQGEDLHEQLKEREAARLRWKRLKEEKDREKEANAGPEITQADRLAEAERNEKKNARSLNKWEAVEKRRMEEQAMKLAALKNRKLTGPVVTTISSKHIYQGHRRDDSPGSGTDGDAMPKKRGPKPKSSLSQVGTSLGHSPTGYAPSPFTPGYMQPYSPLAVPKSTNSPASQYPTYSSALPPITPSASTANTQPPVKSSPTIPPQTNVGWLAGIHEFASMPASTNTAQQSLPDRSQGTYQPTTQVSVSKPNTVTPPIITTISGFMPPSLPDSAVLPNSTSTSSHTSPAINTTRPYSYGNASFSPASQAIPSPQNTFAGSPLAPYKDPSTLSTHLSPYVPTLPVAPPVIEIPSIRNLVTFDRMDELQEDATKAYEMFLSKKKTKAPQAALKEICPVTGLVAHYRDPKTGVPYADLAAYRKIKTVQKHGYRWSAMLECYVGQDVIVPAKGVPVGFV